ncbi:sensor histidine kinase [Oceanibacterium hippocampi]|uniref:histidine kinase n=1 Tax=Oceanibacterium hippocampi TaxID=745714 RepID=A0A1Y5T534_9PROT|nr:ATP-binding protein [Oceanibacterium hippocampi]SLN55989.1 Non-motile and phage-resistance protein [Oceanibacterium hippocampi]
MNSGLRDLLEKAAPIPVDMTCAAVYERFEREPDVLNLAVVKGERPVGMVNRQDLYGRLADRFGRPLYERKAIATLMDPAPFVVDVKMTRDRLRELILTDRPGLLLHGFIGTEEGRYLGIGSAFSVLRATVAELQHRESALDIALVREAEANRSKSIFLANMSHELRTPLNAIIGFADIIRGEIFGPIANARYRDYIDDVHESGQHLLGLINNILDISKAEAGKLELSIDRFDLHRLLRDAARLLAERARIAGVELTVEGEDKAPPVVGDAMKIKQIAINLITNAVKFTPTGGRVTVRCEISRGQFRIVVADTGIGIAAENIARAMEPFSQIDGGDDRRYEGTGLGLPLSRKLAELHDGSLEIESVVGEGTTVRVTVPQKVPTALRIRASENAPVGVAKARQSAYVPAASGPV